MCVHRKKSYFTAANFVILSLPLLLLSLLSSLLLLLSFLCHTFAKKILTHTVVYSVQTKKAPKKRVNKEKSLTQEVNLIHVWNIQVLMDCAHNLIKLLRASQQASEWVEWIFCLTLSKLPERGDANVYTFGWHFRWNALFSLCSFSFSKSVNTSKNLAHRITLPSYPSSLY